MASIPVHDVQGEVLGDRVLPDELFGMGANVPLMHQVVVNRIRSANSTSNVERLPG